MLRLLRGSRWSGGSSAIGSSASERRLRLIILVFCLFQLTDPRLGVRNTVPGHLENFCRAVTGAFMRLAGGHLGQIVDLVGELLFDLAQGFQKLRRVVLGCFKTGFILAQLLESLTWKFSSLA